MTVSSRSAVAAFAVLLLAAVTGCSTDPPSLRVFNERVSKANIQVKPVTGSTMNINDIGGGTGTGYQAISTGTYVVTATIQDEPVSPETGFIASEDNNYTVVVVNSVPPTLRVDASAR